MSDRDSDVGSQGSSGEESWTFVTDAGKFKGDSSSSSAASDFVRVEDDTSGGVNFHRGSPRELGTEMAEHSFARSRQFKPRENEDDPVTVSQLAETPEYVSVETLASSSGADDEAPMPADAKNGPMPTCVPDETPAPVVEELMAAEESEEEEGGFEVLSQPVATSESPSRSRSSSSSSSIVRVSDMGGEEEGERLLRELVLMAEASGGPASYSFIRRPGIPEDGPIPEGVDDRCESDLLPGDDTEDLSEAVNGLGNVDLRDLHFDNRSRLYTHTPNNWLNTLLTFSATLVLALGLGVGIGHCIGSTREQHMWAEVNAHQSLRLQALERELSTCGDQLRHAQTHQQRLSKANAVLTSSVRETQQQLMTASAKAQPALQCLATVDALERRLDRLSDRYEASLSNAFSKHAHVQAAYETCSHQLGFLRPDGKPAAHPGISVSAGTNPTEDSDALSLDSLGTGVNMEGGREVKQCSDCHEMPAISVRDLEIPDTDNSRQKQGSPDMGSSERDSTLVAEISDGGVEGLESDVVKGHAEGTGGVMAGTDEAVERTGGLIEVRDTEIESSGREMQSDGVTNSAGKVSDEATREMEGKMVETDRVLEGTGGASEEDGVTVEVEEQSGVGIPRVTRDKLVTRNTGLKSQEEREEKKRGGKVVDEAKIRGKTGEAKREGGEDEMMRGNARDETIAGSRTEERKIGSRGCTKDKEKDGERGERNEKKRVKGEEKKKTWESQRKGETKKDKSREKTRGKRESEKVTKREKKEEKKEKRRSEKKEDKDAEKHKRRAQTAKEEAMELEKEFWDLKYRMEEVDEENLRLKKLARERLKGKRKSGDAINEVISDVISTVSHVTKDLGKTCGHLAKGVKAAFTEHLFGESREPEREKRDDTSNYREAKPDPPTGMDKLKAGFFGAKRAMHHVTDKVASTLGRLTSFARDSYKDGNFFSKLKTKAQENTEAEEKVETEEEEEARKTDFVKAAYVRKVSGKLEKMRSKISSTGEDARKDGDDFEEDLMEFAVRYWAVLGGRKQGDWVVCQMRFFRSDRGGIRETCAEHLYPWQMEVLVQQERHEGVKNETVVEEKHDHDDEDNDDDEEDDGEEENWFLRRGHFYHSTQKEGENWFLRRGKFYHPREATPDNWYLRRGLQRETGRKKRTDETGEKSWGERSGGERPDDSDPFKDWTRSELDTFWSWEEQAREREKLIREYEERGGPYCIEL